MLYPFLKTLCDEEKAEDIHWVSLNPSGPQSAKYGPVQLHHVVIQPQIMVGYGQVKEELWGVLHGTRHEDRHNGGVFWNDQFADFTYYNRISAELTKRLDAKHDFDFFYIHDFQQLPMGHMLESLKPKVFRWHIPFDETTLPRRWRELLSKYLNSYDSIIVSCKKYLDALERFGYKGDAKYVYPYIDPAPYVKPDENVVRDFCKRYGIDNADRVVLMVARLDPVKGHDRALMAMQRILRSVPKAKLVLVGNGSFSSSAKGMGLSKASIWLSKLEDLAKKLRIEDRIVFTGHESQTMLNAAYQRCDLTILPSVREGFGLVVIESWLFHKPTIVTSTAGIVELIENGKNGVVVDPEDTFSLADKITGILMDPGLARELGEKGFSASRKCLIDEGSRAESQILAKLV